MKDTVSYAHAQYRIWVHLPLKIKYTHKVFEIREFREACYDLMIEIFENHKIEYETIGFDSNHFHVILDMAKWQVSDLVKVIKGTSGKKLLQAFPWIKKMYFYGSGLWSGTKYVYSVGRDKDAMKKYVAKQKFFRVAKNQTTLSDF